MEAALVTAGVTLLIAAATGAYRLLSTRPRVRTRAWWHYEGPAGQGPKTCTIEAVSWSRRPVTVRTVGLVLDFGDRQRRIEATGHPRPFPLRLEDGEAAQGYLYEDELGPEYARDEAVRVKYPFAEVSGIGFRKGRMEVWTGSRRRSRRWLRRRKRDGS
jgi:hypothetical protein